MKNRGHSKKNRFRPFKHLNMQVVFYYFLVSSLLIGIMGITLYYSLSNIVLKDTLETTTESVERSGAYIEVYVEKLKALSDVVVNDADTHAFLETEDEISKVKILDQLKTIIQSDPYFVSAKLVSKSGAIVTNDSDSQMQTSSDMMDEPWYVEAVNSGGMPILTSVRQHKLNMDKDAWVISIGQEIVDEDGHNIGVFLLDIQYSVLENYLDSLELGNEGYSFILNDNDDVVYHKDTAYFDNIEKHSQLIAINNMDDGYESSMQMLTHHYKIKGTNWILVGISSLDSLISIRQQIFKNVLMVGLLLLLIAIVSGMFLANRITKPIKSLETAMKSIETGFKKVSETEGGYEEIDSLAKHYNEMTDQIVILMENIKENEKFLRAYEINALHSQINPHFLYNTLDTIVWMAEFGDSEKVIAVTKSLAQFFRISLSSGKEMISLEDELDHVKHYLFIQKQRYEDHLTYKIECDESLYNRQVPKIILQPIVENAIYHGIREIENTGFILIKAEITESHLQITVSDNGIGFDTQILYSKDTGRTEKNSGVGIENVNQRIKLYFGEPYGIQIDSEIGKGTKVVLRLP